jgi:hypothetical protein
MRRTTTPAAVSRVVDHQVEHRPAGVAERGQVQGRAPEEQTDTGRREGGAGVSDGLPQPTLTAMIAAISERWP